MASLIKKKLPLLLVGPTGPTRRPLALSTVHRPRRGSADTRASAEGATQPYIWVPPPPLSPGEGIYPGFFLLSLIFSPLSLSSLCFSSASAKRAQSSSSAHRRHFPGQLYPSPRNTPSTPPWPPIELSRRGHELQPNFFLGEFRQSLYFSL